jgi:hypothetical protein
MSMAATLAVCFYAKQLIIQINSLVNELCSPIQQSSLPRPQKMFIRVLLFYPQVYMWMVVFRLSGFRRAMHDSRKKTS